MTGWGGVEVALIVGSKSLLFMLRPTGARAGTGAAKGAVRAALISANSFLRGVYEVPTGAGGVGFCLLVMDAMSGRPIG